MTQTVDPTTSHTTIGQPTLRKDGPDKLTGRTRFAGDMPFPGLLHARMVLSPYAHARITAIDTSAAEAIPGVVAVFTGETLGMALAEGSSRAQAPLAIHEVCWCGHPVAVVVGETEAAAEDGASAVDVDYEPLPVVLDPVAAMEPGSPLTRQRQKNETSEIAGGGAHAAVAKEEAAEEEKEELSDNVSNKAHLRMGDIAAGWNEAEVVVERTFRTHPVHQSYIEPQTTTVVSSRSGHQLAVWASSQAMLGVRSDVATALGIPQQQIRVESTPIGGAFGGKFGLAEPLAAAIAYKIRKPVRFAYTRQDDLLAGNPAPQSVITLKLGAKKDGTLVAMQGKAVVDSGAYPGAEAALAGIILASTYRCPNVDLRCYEVLTNKVSVGAYRAPNAPQATFALESAVDELCQELGMDPFAFRLRNGIKEGDPTITHQTWPRVGLLECIEKLQQAPQWQNRAEQKNAPEDLQGWKVGFGVAVGGWPGGTEPAAAACRLEADGSFTVVVGSVDISGSDTSLALIAAEELGGNADSVSVAHDSTDTMPYAGGTGGSKTTYTVGAAVSAAARDARNQILTIASDMLEAAVDDLNIENGNVVVKGVPGKSVSLQQIAGSSMRFGGQYEPIYGRGRSANRMSSPMYTAHLARVAVDPETGDVRVLDYVAAQDVGRAINPAEVEGQIHGGITQGIGWALFEGYEYDENGQLLTSTLMDYALPHIQDVPNITPILVEIPSALGPYGAKGVGEPPVVPVGAAIANAIRDAVGVRIPEIPITPERLYAGIQSTK